MELVYELFVKRSHLWMHKLLVNSQPHSKNVHLFEKYVYSNTIITSVSHMIKSKAESDLLLHQIFEMCDPLCVFWVTADVVFIKEGLV